MAIHENKKYTLTVYNTVTHRNEEVEVTHDVYHAYRRTGWGIENNDTSFFAHEIQMSGPSAARKARTRISRNLSTQKIFLIIQSSR